MTGAQRSRLDSEEKAALARLKHFFWIEWDPIGCGVPEDEYDTYALQAFGMLKNGASTEQVADYLTSIELESMGLSMTPKVKQRNLVVASRAAEIVLST